MAANLGLRGSSATLVFNRGFSDMIKKEGLKVESEDPRLFDYHQIDSRTTVNQLAAASARNPNDFFYLDNEWLKDTRCKDDFRLVSKRRSPY